MEKSTHWSKNEDISTTVVYRMESLGEKKLKIWVLVSECSAI